MLRSGASLGLVERERLGGGALEGARGAFGRRGRVGLAQGCLALDRVVVGEVEAGFEAGAAAGDVAPFLEGALVVEEHVGAVDGCALGGVAGERVAVVEMLGGVGEGDASLGAGRGRERSSASSSSLTTVARMPLRSPSRLSLWRQRTWSPTRNSRLTEDDGAAAEPVLVEHECVRGLVELVDVGAVVGEHHGADGAVARLPPPVAEQPLLRLDRVIVHGEAAVAGGVGEVGLGVAGAELGERFAFERVALTSVGGELDRVEAVAERLVEPAGADGGKLAPRKVEEKPAKEPDSWKFDCPRRRPEKRCHAEGRGFESHHPL